MSENAEIPTPQTLNRREAGKFALLGAAALAIPRGVSRLATNEVKDKTEYKPTLRILDVSGLSASKILQTEPSASGVNVENASFDQLREIVPTTASETRAVLAGLLAEQYRDHGRNVLQVTREAQKQFDTGWKLENPKLESMNDAVSIRSIRHDELGNPICTIFVDRKRVAEKLRNSDETVVNLSFELGELEFKYELYKSEFTADAETRRHMPQIKELADGPHYYAYDGTEISEAKYNEQMKVIEDTKVTLLDPADRRAVFLDGYAGDKTYSNLREVALLAAEFPDKIFVIAGGNPTTYEGETKRPDIGDARHRLFMQGIWPPNIIVVGFEGKESGFVGPASFGSDVYVDYETLHKLGFQQASSYATPYISEYVRELIAGGVKKLSEIKANLRGATRRYADGSNYVYRVFDQRIAKQQLAALGG